MKNVENKQDALKSMGLIKKAQNEAQAKANNLVSKSLTPNILKNNVINRWNGVTPTIVGSEHSQYILPLK